MPASLADQLRAARVYDLEQPRFAGMPIHPAHRPGYFYALHRRHRDTYQPDSHAPRPRDMAAAGCDCGSSFATTSQEAAEVSPAR
jgi:hypothetical protein